MEHMLEEKFAFEQSIMDTQIARAVDYMATIEEVDIHAESFTQPPEDIVEAQQAILKTYNETKDPKIQLLCAEWLADGFIRMISKDRILDPRGTIANATLNYRGEIFMLGVNKNKACEGCLTRPVVFPESNECVTCKLTGNCDTATASLN